MGTEKWTDWYVLHTKGRGLRLLKKPQGTEVAGGAGSVSNRFHVIEEQCQKRRVKEVLVIRFTTQWAKKKKSLLEISFTLDEYLDWLDRKKLGPTQRKLEGFD